MKDDCYKARTLATTIIVTTVVAVVEPIVAPAQVDFILTTAQVWVPSSLRNDDSSVYPPSHPQERLMHVSKPPFQGMRWLKEKTTFLPWMTWNY